MEYNTCPIFGCTLSIKIRGLCINHSSISNRMSVMTDDMVELYNTAQGMCTVPGCSNTYRLSLDHDHNCCPGNQSCGRCIRGLICHSCNGAMGQVKDNPERLRQLADYLEQQTFVQLQPWVPRYRTPRRTK